MSEPSARQRGYRDDFFLKLMSAVHVGNQQTLDGVLRQRAHLLRSLAGARAQSPPDVVGLLITAAELHTRADLGVVDAAEQTFAAGMPAGGAQLVAARANAAVMTDGISGVAGTAGDVAG